MGLLYSIFMLLVLTAMLGLLFGMIGLRWPDLLRALLGRAVPARDQEAADARRFSRA
ncbi:hypothetical protein [Polymorphobacter sp.]|uniref:hypothetical protein n=1 Tax=Polymorphobacter sp. TaxID=1909290 RepID=UPI003F7128E5